MWVWASGFAAGWALALCTVKLYMIGKLEERWHVVTRMDEKQRGYELWAKKGREKIMLYRVGFERKSSVNPENTFSDQMTQARSEAFSRVEALNANERIIRERNRKAGLPGGL